MRSLSFLILFATVVGLRMEAFACKNLGLHLSQPSYYSQTGGSMMDTFSVIVNANTTAGDCNYFLTFDYGSASSFSSRAFVKGTATWPYQIYQDAGATQILKKLPEATSCGDVICGQLNAGSSYITKSHPYTIVVDGANLWRSAGTYRDSVIVRLYKGPLSAPVLQSSVTLSMTFDSHKKFDISVVPTGGSFNLNQTSYLMKFPGMTTGMQRTADIILKYNAGAKLFAWSSNGGKLKHAGLPDTIDYTFSLNGTQINIPWWTQVAVKTGTSPASGSVNPVVITIGNTTGKSKGVYRDTINLVVQSNE